MDGLKGNVFGFETNQLPDILFGVMSDDVQASVIADDLKVSMIRRQPSVLDGYDLDTALADDQSPRRLLPPIAGITIGPDLKWAIGPER